VALRLDEIVARLGGELRGSGATVVSRIGTLEGAGPSELAFLSNPKYRHQLAATRAAAVIMAPPAVDGPFALILTPQPYLYYARVAQWLSPDPEIVFGIHSSAVVEGEVATDASVGANVWIGAGAKIGARVVIGANCSIGPGVEIGADSRLASNVAIYPGVRLGERCLIHSGAVIGADGFGFAREPEGAWVKIPQIGRVLIGDDVEIGAGTTIDRGALGDTVIGDGVKLDNQIQVGHNVRIGAHTAIAGCAAIAFAHHADDLAQTTLLNLIYHGRAETMLPRRDYFDGRLPLIRPLYRIPEKELRRFARVCEFPPPPPACPQAQDSRRELARSLLRQMVDQHPLARVNLLRAGLGPQG